MESTSIAAWAGPYELQLAKNWAAEEVAQADDAQAWASAAVGHPLQYGSIADIFGSSCSLQPYAVLPASSYPTSCGQQQLVEQYNYYNYYAAAATQAQHDRHHDPENPKVTETYINIPDEKLFQKTKEFKDGSKLMKTKMHRYPPSIQALGDWCTVPKVVAIGPYYHHRDHLQKVEDMKHVAAQYCIKEYKKVKNNSSSNLSALQDLYDAAVLAVAKIDACALYDKDVMAGMGYEDDFLPMMFCDACFLVMYILRKSGAPLDADLSNFFESNDSDIALDILLLENQIPLQVVHAVMSMCTANPLERMKELIAMWHEDGFLQDRVVAGWTRVGSWDPDDYYNAPHLLGLLRIYAVGKRSSRGSKYKVLSPSDIEKLESIPFSAGPTELAEMGIFLTANEKMELPDMGLDTKWIIFAELSMAPLSVNEARARWLISMAALELCTTPDFLLAGFQDSAVCSYLLLLSMLVHREEDVHALRRNGILKGAGLSNNKTLDLFTSLHSLRKGYGYALVMLQIASYKKNSRRWIVVYAFLYNNWKYIVAVGSAIGGFIGIITAVMGLKGTQ